MGKARSEILSMSVRCCITGGGPAGMMLGLLLARAGVDVAVLEKHADFLRDFRGDTIHPSTLEVMHELGFLEELLRLPHQEVRTLTGQIGDVTLTLADFSHLSTRCQFVAFMPQWDFLTFLAGQNLTRKVLRVNRNLIDESTASGQKCCHHRGSDGHWQSHRHRLRQGRLCCRAA